MAEDDYRALVEHWNSLPEEKLSSISTDDLQRAVIGVQQLGHSGVPYTNETQCLQQAELEANVTHNEGLHCATAFDTVLCWPRTKAGNWAILPCFEEFKGVHYDTTENASRFCHANGSWDNYSNYTSCHQQTGDVPMVPEFSASVDLPAIIYNCGYFISLATLILGLIIFISFKDLRCLRNTIHANLFLTYITSALLWILTYFLQVITSESSEAGCITLVIMYQYFYLTTFFWMFVEGLYLYTLVVQTFSAENISFITYALIGWGCPAICIIIWSTAKAFASSMDMDGHINGLEIECSWMRESHVDWILKGPASLAILSNLVFLVRIMWVLITKLRSAHTLETRQYYKASKALLVLIPLFGITYLLVLTGPEQGISRHLFESMRAILLSTQGFFVALFYCFLNSEVRQTLRHRFLRWRESRDIHSTNSLKNRRSKDYSHRSRTESLRLTSTSPVPTGHYE
ncbi:Dh44-R2 [Drosophila busckii]|uniref:Diuretic hormone receptor n=1 Tax=Drosophila busckii TaxID=30019 RepID=A0A0M4ETT2_DROBS|nr:Dh44-R2 [Drosophila busckii]